jgi:hypothetical protein
MPIAKFWRLAGRAFREQRMTDSALQARDRRMRRMIRRLDVDVLELAYAKLGAEIDSARMTCLTCPHTAACRRWLQDTPTERPTFCPNLGRFERFIPH